MVTAPGAGRLRVVRPRGRRRRPGVFFTHNDSGSAALVHAFEVGGEPAGTPCPGWINDWRTWRPPPPPGSGADRRLYVADIGDNLRRRSRAHPGRGGAGARRGGGAYLRLLATWRVAYPDGLDAETLLVHPITGRVDLLSKSLTGAVGVYRVPAVMGAEDEIAPLRKLGALDLTALQVDRLLTGGDWGPDGERLVLRTYNQLLLWRTDPCAPDGWWTAPPTVLQAPPEDQGEAVTFGLDGHLYTTSEGRPMELTRMACLDPRPAQGCAADLPAARAEAAEAAPAPDPDPPPKATPDPRCGCHAGPTAPVGWPRRNSACARRGPTTARSLRRPRPAP